MTRDVTLSAVAFAIAASAVSPMYAAYFGSVVPLVVLVTVLVVGVTVVLDVDDLLLLPHAASAPTATQARTVGRTRTRAGY